MNANRHAVLITDCHCDNAGLRQDMAWVNFAGTDKPGQPRKITSDIDGAGMLVDALVESQGLPWVILCQSSPRDEESRKKRNGSPFGYFWHKETLAIVSLDGYMLSLAKELGFITETTEIHQMDIHSVLDSRVKARDLTETEALAIHRSQFRSLKFVPRAAGWILNGVNLPTTRYCFDDIPDFGKRVWWVDNFGNCKTSIRTSDLSYKYGKTLHTSCGDFACIYNLGDVPKGQSAAIIGSSGLVGDEFIELIVQGKGSGSAAKRFGLEIGSALKGLYCD